MPIISKLLDSSSILLPTVLHPSILAILEGSSNDDRHAIVSRKHALIRVLQCTIARDSVRGVVTMKIALLPPYPADMHSADRQTPRCASMTDRAAQSSSATAATTSTSTLSSGASLHNLQPFLYLLYPFYLLYLLYLLYLRPRSATRCNVDALEAFRVPDIMCISVCLLSNKLLTKSLP